MDLMRRVFFPTAAVLFLATCLLAAASLNLVDEMPFSARWTPMRVPKWSHGALLSVQYHDTNLPVILVFERNREHTVPLTIPGAHDLLVYDWDRGADGTLAVTGSMLDADGRPVTFLAWITPGGATPQVIRTTPYSATMVAVAPDGAFWTAGRESNPVTRTTPPNACVIRRFERSGKVSACFIPQSTIRDTATLLHTRNTFRVTPDRVVWYSSEGRYVEISLTAGPRMDVSIPFPGGQPMNPNTGFAVTDGGDVFMNGSSGPLPPSMDTSVRDGIFRLDRAARKWVPVPKPEQEPSYHYIYGAEGASLVTPGANGWIRFYGIDEH
ncbi:MAG: hypothetical protein IT165_09690 [Bryobacterales bacterium]|nr:hypothetical protein [Bryobacterales bacterium]